MSGKLFANIIFSLFYIIKQLFIQIMCENQLIQVNRLQEIMKNVYLPLVLTHPPEEDRRLDLCHFMVFASTWFRFNSLLKSHSSVQYQYK